MEKEISISSLFRVASGMHTAVSQKEGMELRGLTSWAPFFRFPAFISFRVRLELDALMSLSVCWGCPLPRRVLLPTTP